MLMLLVFFPLFNFMSIWVLDIFLGKRKAGSYVAYSYLFIVLLGFWAMYKISIVGNLQYWTVGTWVNCGLFVINWGFIFDSLSVSMLWMVSIISGVVHVYSLGYMAADKYLIKFMSYLSLFTFFMFILVTGDNFMQLFLGWEGIGLCSYLLISFWNTSIQANKSALKALVVNSIGDFGFLCGVCLIYYIFSTLDFSVVFLLVPFFVENSFSIMGINIFCLNMICFFLFLGSMGKSAQVGLHSATFNPVL